MPSPCFVVMCGNTGTHQFPKDETLKRLWIKAIRLDEQRKIGLNLRKNSRICSSHFKSTDFVFSFKEPGDVRKRILKRGVVPSIFPWTSSASLDEVSTPSSRPELIFNPASALKTYSKNVLTPVFVEALPLLASVKSEHNINQDPLAITNGSYVAVKSEIDECIPTEGELNINGSNVAVKSEIDDECIPTEDELNIKIEIEVPCIDDEALYEESMDSASCTDSKIVTSQPIHSTYQPAFFMKSIKEESTETIKTCIPMDFHAKYPPNRIVLDATECPVKKPNLPLAQQITFQHVKIEIE